MKKLIKRITLLLCAVLLLGLLGTTAFAADNNDLNQASPNVTAVSKSFKTFEELKALLNEELEPNTWLNYYGDADEFVFSESLTLPENVTLQMVDVKIVIPKGVTLTSYSNVSMNIYGGLVVNGTFTTSSCSLDIRKELTVTGSLNVVCNVFMDPDTVLTGWENIHFSNSGLNVVYQHNITSATEFYDALEKVKTLNSKARQNLSINSTEGFTFNKSFSIPENGYLSISTGTNNPVYTIPSGVTATINGKMYLGTSWESYIPVLKVAGKLVNNNYIDVQCITEDTAMLIFTGTYSGKGTLEVGHCYYGIDFKWDDIVTGLNPDNLEITGGHPAYYIRDVSHLTRLSAPKNLTWHVNMESVRDESGKSKQQLVTRMGAISWETGEIRDPYFDGYDNTNYFVINVYRDDQVVLSNYGNVGFSEYFEQLGFPNCMEIPSYIEWESGTYYFTVQAVPNSGGTESEYRSSVVVASEPWVYTKPANLDTPTNLTWNWPSISWSGPSGAEKFELEVQYAPTLNDEFQWAYGFTKKGVNGYTFVDYEQQMFADAYGAGYYRFKVRVKSGDITDKTHSDWSEYSATYYYDGKYEAPEPEKVVPAAPTVEVTNDAATGKPVISWNKVDGAAKYELYWASSEKGTYNRIATTTATTLTNKSAVAGKMYYYKVKAVAADGTASEFSNIVNRTCDLPQPVVSVTNVASTGKVKLSWTAIEGAVKYELYRATSKTGTYSKIGTTTGTSITNTSGVAGTTYYYKVRALHEKSGAHSAYSAIIERTCDLPQPKVTATNVASTGKVKLSWEKVEGATKYELYRATSKTGTYSKIGSTSNTSITNTSGVAGTTYYYKVKAIHSKSAANSAYSSIVERTCDLAQPVVKATNVASSGKVKLTWDAIEGATKYELYRATSKDGTYTKIGSTSNAYITNTSGVAGTTYYYKVRAICGNSAATSAYSSIVERTCDLAQPTLTVKLNSSGKPVLTWSKVEGATKYQVYRATSKSGTYSLIYTTASGTSVTNKSNLVAGTTYYYKVIAIHSKSAANSAYSAIKSVTFK